MVIDWCGTTGVLRKGVNEFFALCLSRKTISSIKLSSAKPVPMPRMKNALLKSSSFIATPSNEVLWLFTKHRSALLETSCLIQNGSSPVSPSLITLNLQTNKPKMVKQTNRKPYLLYCLLRVNFWCIFWILLQYHAKRSAYWKWTWRLKATLAIFFELLC